jgi:molybdate transport system substrate-binding protein
VAAAADLNVALAELITRYTATHPVDVTVSYGSSGTLFSQLLNGAPFDLFLSADVEYPRRLAARGLAAEGTEFTYAVGRLVLWTRNLSPLDLRSGGVRALADPRVGHIAIANPEHAPYGRAAVAALRSAAVYDAVKPKLIYGENVAQALQFVQSGSADVGLVALSLALSPNTRGTGTWTEVPSTDYPRLDQGGVILKSATDPESALAFRDYLVGEGRALLQQSGFGMPER